MDPNHFLTDFIRKEGYAIRLYMCVYTYIYYLLLLERSSFSGGTTVKRVSIRQFKVCHSLVIFVWAIHHVKMDQLSQNLVIFFMEVTLVCTPKIVNVCLILFTGPCQNLEYR